MSASIGNNSVDTLTVTLLDTDGSTVLASYGTETQGAVWSAGSFYRNAYLQVSNGAVSATNQVYLSNATFIAIEGSAAIGYRVEVQRAADYESMFWVGFGLYVGLWVATLFMKIVRAGVNQNVG